MKQCKWLTSLCLVLLLSLLLFITTHISHAEDSNIPDGLIYAVDESSKAITITGYLGTTSVLELPSTIDGLPVTKIGAYAFSGCGSLIEVIIPSSITAMENYAFYGCMCLAKITIPNSVTTIGSYAFYRCESLSEIVIPGSVTAIGDGAFEDCLKLTKLRFMGSVPEMNFNLLLNTNMQDYTVYYPAGDSTWDSMATTDYSATIAWIPVSSPSITNFKKINTFANGIFIDIVPNSWYEVNVARSYELGLMNGTGNSSFSPSKNITIAEVVTIAARIHSIYQTGTINFVQGSLWYQVYVDHAVENGIIGANSYPDYTDLATRAMCAAILGAAVPESELQAINNITVIPDVTQDSVWGRAVYLLYNAGVLTGIDEYGTFAPSDKITRAEVAVIATRIVDISLRKPCDPKLTLPMDKSMGSVNESIGFPASYSNTKRGPLHRSAPV